MHLTLQRFDMGSELTPSGQATPTTKNSSTGSPHARSSMMKPVGVGILIFVVGVAGNILAAWFQQSVMENVFTTRRLLLIGAVAFLGIVISAWLERSSRATSTVTSTDRRTGDGVSLTKLRLWKSRFTGRGRGIAADDVSAYNSQIHIDTNP